MKCVRQKFNENKLNKKCLFFFSCISSTQPSLRRKMSITLNLYNIAVESIEILSCVKSCMEIAFFLCYLI